MSDEAVSERPVSPHRTWYQGMPSPNPGGRPKQVAHLQELAREHTPAALAKIVALMNDEKTSRLTQLACARELLDRAYGKPMQSIAVESPEDEVLNEMQRPGYLIDTARRLAFLLTVGNEALNAIEAE